MEDRHLAKAKRLDNGEWVEGYIMQYPTGEWRICRKCDNPPDCDPMWRKVLISYEVDPSTICRCTGYPNIWEKDIFQCEEGRYVIIFCEQSLAWEAQSVFSSESISLGEFSPEEIDVIGNAIDNSELLEVTE